MKAIDNINELMNLEKSFNLVTYLHKSPDNYASNEYFRKLNIYPFDMLTDTYDIEILYINFPIC